MPSAVQDSGLLAEELVGPSMASLAPSVPSLTLPLFLISILW